MPKHLWPRLLAVLAAVALSGCERPPVDTEQRGYRGTGMQQVTNPRTEQARQAANMPPEISPPARVRPNAPKAGTTYQNVQVLKDLSIAEFGRTMDAMTTWVSPKASCAYCHVEGNFADDGKYTKVVARRMLQMTQDINSKWAAHVGSTGVTCYTCHRGENLPAERWFLPVAQQRPSGFIGNRAEQNLAGASVGLTSLPDNVFSTYLLAEQTAAPIRVAATQALPGGTRTTTQQTESTYGLMIHLSSSLGVNCTYCHNSRAFSSWGESSPQRVTAWHGLRMVRNVNSEYLSPLGSTFPEIPLGRLGPSKDAAKVNCATCHRGVNKPLYGAKMAEHYPALSAPAAAAASAPEVRAAAEPAAQPPR